jgi:hypothetical protein
LGYRYASNLGWKMALSLFQSTTDIAVFGFTYDPIGTNLPDEFAAWRLVDQTTLTGGGMLIALLSDDAVAEAVVQKGVHLVRIAAPDPPFPPVGSL